MWVAICTLAILAGRILIVVIISKLLGQSVVSFHNSGFPGGVVLWK